MADKATPEAPAEASAIAALWPRLRQLAATAAQLAQRLRAQLSAHGTHAIVAVDAVADRLAAALIVHTGASATTARAAALAILAAAAAGGAFITVSGAAAVRPGGGWWPPPLFGVAHSPHSCVACVPRAPAAAQYQGVRYAVGGGRLADVEGAVPRKGRRVDLDGDEDGGGGDGAVGRGGGGGRAVTATVVMSVAGG